MGYSYKIFQQHRTVVVKEEGAADLHSISASIKSLIKSKKFDPHFHIIVDLRKIESTPPPSDLFRIRDTLIMLKSNFLGGVTIMTTERNLFAVKIISTMAEVYGFKCAVTTQSDLLDTLTTQST